MIYDLLTKLKRDVRYRLVSYGILIPILSLIQVTFIPIINIEGFTPDLILILVVWISLSEGRFVGTIAGFFAGLVLDASSFELLGVHALSKTIAGFFAGMWFKEDRVYQNTRSLKFLLITAGAAIISNLIYYLLYMDIKTFDWTSYFFQSVPASAAYTAIIASIPMLLFTRRKREF